MTANEGDWPAFPVAEDHKVAASVPWTCGMTLRDYFAAKAMAATIASGDYADCRDGDALAEESYAVADAMIVQRLKAVR